ncbi:hypothetical protein ABZU94_38970 [Streptomyces mirabilis]|uniref:hypothetical protein n=1 Tax=Streptomyces sp. NPDC005388 TaxID=3156717 RepID=UPI0033A1E91E
MTDVLGELLPVSGGPSNSHGVMPSPPRTQGKPDDCKGVDEYAVSQEGRGLGDIGARRQVHGLPGIQPAWTNSRDWALIAGRSIANVREELGRHAEGEARRLDLRAETDRFTVVKLIGFSP